MAYSVDFLYNKFLDKIDKEGSDIISPPQVMELLESETYNFIDQQLPYLENNQQIKDSILPLSKPFNLPVMVNPSNSAEMIMALPGDYLHLETAWPSIPGINVRETRIIRKGEVDRNRNNPNKKPEPRYLKIIEYGDYIAMLGCSVTQGVKLQGFYIAKPDFGNPNAEDLGVEIAVNLPDNTLERILLLMVTAYRERTSDPSFQASLMQEQSYGRNTK